MIMITEDHYHMLKSIAEGNEETNVETDAEETVIDTLPISYRASGKALINFFKRNDIRADDKHRLVIQGETIPHSHYTDSLHDLLRYRMGKDPPHGFEVLAQTLANKNVSRELITNLARLKKINELKSNSSSEEGGRNGGTNFENKSLDNGPEEKGEKPGLAKQFNLSEERGTIGGSEKIDPNKKRTASNAWLIW